MSETLETGSEAGEADDEANDSSDVDSDASPGPGPEWAPEVMPPSAEAPAVPEAEAHKAPDAEQRAAPAPVPAENRAAPAPMATPGPIPRPVDHHGPWSPFEFYLEELRETGELAARIEVRRVVAYDMLHRWKS